MSTLIPSRSELRRFDRPWRQKGSSDMFKPSRGLVATQYLLLILGLFIALAPFIWQLSTSLKGAAEDIYVFPPHLIPQEPTFEHYGTVSRTIPVMSYTWHSLLVAVGSAVSNVFLATLAGYALGAMRFRGKGIAIAILLSTLLLPAEVTLTSQYLTIKSLGLANSLWGVFLPKAVTVINVMLMATACRMIPESIVEASILDGASTMQRIRHVIWPNVRGMAAVVALFAFIEAWDDFLWPLVVLSDPAKYTLTVGMNYLSSSTLGTNPRVVAAGTIISLIPVIVLFASCQKFFFRGVQEGGVKG